LGLGVLTDLQYLLAVGGVALTVVTSVGGEAITLATSGAGVVTSKFGSAYTVATAAAVAEITENTNNNGGSSFQVQSTLLVGAATIVASTLIGAFIAL